VRVRLLLAALACGLMLFATPSKAAACLAYGPTLDFTVRDAPDIAVIGRATAGGPPSAADFVLTDVIVIRGTVDRPVKYGPGDFWDCHSPEFSRGDRILALQWGDRLTKLSDFSGAAWRIDDAGNVLPGLHSTIRIAGKTPATVAEILSYFHIAIPDAATRPPSTEWATAVGLLLLIAAAGLVLYKQRNDIAS
jgi:hypothetical protein